MSARALKKPTKQLPLIEVQETRADDLLTEEERQERLRLREIEKRENEARHNRWLEHNRGKFNFRPCPCSKPECKRARASR